MPVRAGGDCFRIGILGPHRILTGSLQLALRQRHKFVDILRATAAASVIAQAEFSNDLPGGKEALTTGRPHI